LKDSARRVSIYCGGAAATVSLLAEFHLRCDSRANILTLIADTDGNIFDSITPVKWESSEKWKGDNSLRSFLFTLTNPHRVPLGKFALRAEQKQYAVGYNPVDDNYNQNRHSYTRMWNWRSNSAYANDTDIKSIFMGAEYFTVKEVEVFKIAD
jgi:hypothetical protein